MQNERYYYTRMSKDEKIAYKAIYYGLKDLSNCIEFQTPLPLPIIQDIYFKILYDTPLFYFVNQRKVRVAHSGLKYTILPEYIYSGQEIAALNHDLRRIVDKVVSHTSRFKGNPFRIEKYLHDSVVKSVAYDYESLQKSDSFNAHAIVGAFIDNKAVCEGIAKAFKLLCNEVSIKCIVVLGKADQKGVFDGETYHAWNLVKIGSDSYHVDPTWDNLFDREVEHISYDYFNVKTEDILKDHRPIGSLPYCDATQLNYFYSTKSIISTYSELVDLITERFNAKTIMFKTTTASGEFYSPDELQKKALSAVSLVMLKKLHPKRCVFFLNPSQMIGKIIFPKIDLTKRPRIKND